MSEVTLTLKRSGEVVANDRVELGNNHDPDYRGTFHTEDEQLTIELNEVVT